MWTGRRALGWASEMRWDGAGVEAREGITCLRRLRARTDEGEEGEERDDAGMLWRGGMGHGGEWYGVIAVGCAVRDWTCLRCKTQCGEGPQCCGLLTML